MSHARFQFNVVAKANDEIKTGLSIMKSGDNLCPQLYIDDFYTDYLIGHRNLDSIAQQLCEARVRNDRPSVIFPIQEILEFDNVKDHIFPRLCDPDTNTERLKELVYSLEDKMTSLMFGNGTEATNLLERAGRCITKRIQTTGSTRSQIPFRFL